MNAEPTIRERRQLRRAFLNALANADEIAGMLDFDCRETLVELVDRFDATIETVEPLVDPVETVRGVGLIGAVLAPWILAGWTLARGLAD